MATKSMSISVRMTNDEIAMLSELDLRGALTPSEHRVARMASKGMANREIAQALFVSVRTVETHLGHVYQKLDLSSREGLAAALGEEDGGPMSAVANDT